jgi:hypothetical protein
MFNTYQELVDRIEELLKERERLTKKIKHLEDLYSRIPRKTIDHLHFYNIINDEEKLFWVMLKLRKEKDNE